MFPAEEKIGEIKAALENNLDVILTAPPGSGKTTCIPPALLDCDFLGNKKIIMLEPRRIAARNCANFISEKLCESVGGTIGYQVRLERKISSRTRIEIVTEGLLTQRILSDPELSDVALVIFDEFHERSLACDLSFALALDVKKALREDLRIMVMSATLDVEELTPHLPSPVVVRAEGRMFPVVTHYLGDMPMAGAVAKALRETDGDILCFLPGEGEIRRTHEAISSCVGEDVLPMPLYGAMTKEAQDAVFRPSQKRKVILATSIAETSVTIPNISCVIDSGLMRIPRFSASTGMSGLVTMPLSQDRAEQRKGRAGRVRDGVCYRLWDEGANAMRAKKMTPEILDADLCSLVLTAASWGAFKRDGLPWLTLPPASTWERSAGLLQMLGAIDSDGRLTDKGEKMSHIPMHPRLANMMLFAGGDAAILAAQIEEGSKSRETDIRCRVLTPRIKELAKRFATVKGSGRATSEGAALALAYPDRIAKNRGNGSFRMVSGRGASLDRDDPLAKEKYIVCCELDDRPGDAKLFLGCPITEEEILSLFGNRITEVPVCEWDKSSERIRAIVERRLGEMTISERPLEVSDDVSERIREAWHDALLSKGISNLPCWTKETLQLRERISFLARTIGNPWSEVTDEKIAAAMLDFIGGFTKFRDLEKVDLSCVFDSMLSAMGVTRRDLDKLAPMRIEVPSGSKMIVHYEGNEPTVEVRLQECFGLMETPKVALGRVSVVMTLLSPAYRPIQITKDLAGFWKEGYQLVRKDMRGRYPKHYWPEDPFSAIATKKTKAHL